MLYRFGNHELDDGTLELRRDGRPVDLQPKVLQLLVHLIRHRDRVLSKAELLAALWPDTVVTASSLTRAVSLARIAIDDTAPARVIVNVSRLGYRFRAAVEVVPNRLEPDSSASRYVGRKQIRARLDAALDAALAGHGRILLLTGEAGIGKTRTADLLAERAGARGARVIRAGADVGGSPHRPWTGALRMLAADDERAMASLTALQRSDLARTLPELVAPAAAAPTSRTAGPDVDVRLFEAVQLLLTRAAASKPLALFLEDLHAADSESLWLLEFVGSALATLPIAIVATSREQASEPSERYDQALERLLRASSLERWPLHGLTSAEIDEFVRLADAGEPDPELLATLEEQTGGNPLLLGESLRSLAARDLLARPRSRREWAALLPTGIRHLIAPKLRRLSPPALDLLGVAAACGLESPWPLLARCTGELDAERIRHAWEAAGLVEVSADGGRIRFPHLLIRESIYTDLVPEGELRRAVHARIANALPPTDEMSDDALDFCARHACLAAPRVVPGRAAALAVAAGDRATRRLEFERASVWYQRALDALQLETTRHAEERGRILLALGAAQLHAFGLDCARVSYARAADHARAIGRTDLFAQAAVGFAHRPSSSGSGDPDVIALLEEALARAPVDDALSVIRIRSRLAAELRYKEPDRSQAMMDAAVSAARRLAEPALLAQTLDDCSFVRQSALDPEGWIALNGEIVRAARAAHDLELELLGNKGRVTGFLETGRLDDVDREILALGRTAASLRTPYARWLDIVLRAMRALVDGDLELAEQHIGASVEASMRADSPTVAVESLAQIAYLRLEQGRAGEISEAARGQVRRFPDAPAWRATLARLLVASGERSEAREELERVARGGFRDVPRDRGWLPALALAAEVACEIGDTSTADTLYGELAGHERLSVVMGSGVLYYGPVSHHLGRLAAVGSRWDAAIRHYGAAADAEERAGARLWRARTRAAWARALLARGRPDDRERALRLAAESNASAASGGWALLASELRKLPATR